MHENKDKMDEADVTVESTTEEHTTIDNPSTTSKDKEKRRGGSSPSFEIVKMAKILPTYPDISGFLDQKIRTDWSTIEIYQDKMGNPFYVEYVEGISQQSSDSLNYGIFVDAYAEYLSNGLQVPNDGLENIDK
ncbi:hypothetical protein T459_30195 [Capsicum annuum]|uniref:Uncharacterized protein n=1 Tax=Capsicum annuum TaxID=4072 RepID=A0A2G2Y7Q9_CAPAN|nr:hypothetical protein T459_30195 [Capsicum annuum]